MENLKDEVVIFFSKIYTIAAWILLGLVGKFSYNIMIGKRITLVQAFASTGIALFVGIISAVLCRYFKADDQAPFIVPIATLLSDKLVMALIAINWKNIVHDWIQWWSDFTKKEE